MERSVFIIEALDTLIPVARLSLTFLEGSLHISFLQPFWVGFPGTCNSMCPVKYSFHLPPLSNYTRSQI